MSFPWSYLFDASRRRAERDVREEYVPSIMPIAPRYVEPRGFFRPPSRVETFDCQKGFGADPVKEMLNKRDWAMIEAAKKQHREDYDAARRVSEKSNEGDHEQSRDDSDPTATSAADAKPSGSGATDNS